MLKHPKDIESDLLSGGLVYLFHVPEIQMTHCNWQWKPGTAAEINNVRTKSLSTRELCHINFLLERYYNFTVRQCVAWRALCSTSLTRE